MDLDPDDQDLYAREEGNPIKLVFIKLIASCSVSIHWLLSASMVCYSFNKFFKFLFSHFLAFELKEMLYKLFVVK